MYPSYIVVMGFVPVIQYLVSCINVNFSITFSFLMYADDHDTTIYFNLDNFPAINREQEINREVEKLNIWFQLNKLTLNVDKTNCMFFSQTSSYATY